MTTRRLALGLAVVLLVGSVGGIPAIATGEAQPPSMGDVVTDATTGDAGINPATSDDPVIAGDLTDDAEGIAVTQRLHLTPDEPGEVEVVLAASLPERVESFGVQIPDRVRVTDTDGFRLDGRDRYEWTGEPEPTLTYDLRANETATGEGPEPGSGTYLFADTGSWAIVRPPQLSTDWSWRGEDVALEWDLQVPGAGAAGESIAFLGSHQTYSRQVHGQTFDLVVPDTAEMRERPAAVLDTFTDASAALRIGDRDERVFTVVAPTGVDWAVRGIQTGDSDMWVLGSESLTVADNTWLHEYVHTRQRLNTTRATKWLTEASATYYANLLALDGGLVSFEEFRSTLARGEHTRFEDVVLSDPSSWTYRAEYDKGALVIGDLDRRIRLATDGGETFETVLGTLNERDGRLDYQQFLDSVDETANDNVRETADRYVRTDAGPTMWSLSDHETAFNTALARFSYQPAAGSDTYRIESQYRNVSSETIPPLAVGERLTVPVRVSNDGSSAGEYDATLTVDGETVARTTGRLAAGDATTVELSYTFDEPGAVSLGLSGNTMEVTVSDPVTPDVEDVSAEPTSLEGPGTVSVTATVANGAAVPAAGVVSFTRNGTVVANRTVRLAPNGTRDVSTAVDLSAPGQYVLGANDRTTTVAVRGITARETDAASGPTSRVEGTVGTPHATDGDATRTSGPGFTALLALLVIVFSLWLR